jgi:NTP pyrophosphatase (non-canonical NTP hydrolase)
MNAQTNCHNQKQVEFVNHFNDMQKAIHQTAIEKGWWALPREVGTVIMNCVTELAEMFDALAHRNPYDKHCPDFTAAEVEAADVIIRLMDAAEQYGWDIAGAIVAKAEYNKGRDYRHGKDF